MDGCTPLGRLTTYFQPIRLLTTTGLLTGRIAFAEALLREKCTDGVYRFPKGLMDNLENHPDGAEGLREITRFVLFDACRASLELREIYGTTFPVAINVSPKQLSADLVRDVQRTLARANLTPASLIVEVTEERGAISTQMIDAANDLERIGVRVAIDDLGVQAGNRALMLSHEIIKLDQALIKQSTCLLAHLRLAKLKGKEAVVEGVEWGHELAMVRRFAADVGFSRIFIQGFLGGYRPMPLRRLSQLCEAERDVRVQLAA